MSSVHSHHLSRDLLLTHEDGQHVHAFQLPTGEIVYTLSDGAHRHSLDSFDSERTSAAISTHRHAVVLPGTTTLTEWGGEHDHLALMHETSVDGDHQHILILEDGTELESLTRQELMALMDAPQDEDSQEEFLEEIADTSDLIEMAVAKAEGEKRIAYGVVLDPYVIDAHGDLIPPHEVEKAAHEYMEKRQVVGIQHKNVDPEAKVLESFLVPYPSHQDYQKAMTGQEHSVYLMPYGDQKVHSGTWILGVQFSEERWELIKAGKVTGYSIGGFGVKKKTNVVDKPTVNIIELQQ